MAMLTSADAFEAALRKRVTERIAELQESATAVPAAELPIINHAIGRIAGLKEVFTICDDVQSELSKR